MSKPIPTDITTWSADMRYDAHERASIKMDSRIHWRKAMLDAMQETWEAYQKSIAED